MKRMNVVCVTMGMCAALPFDQVNFVQGTSVNYVTKMKSAW